jgi:NADH:ubiquinone oxidoreductase subunit E
LADAVREELGIEPGQTTRDGRFSYELSSCMGGCNEGPVIWAGDTYYTHIRPEEIPGMLAKLKLLAELK